ncbi:MAG: DUF5777 family beta-barrel protein [Bacteroidales bacterium]
MKKITALLLGLFMIFPVFSQDEEEDRPERPAFETALLIDNQTVVTPFKGSYLFEIHHRFGTVKNGITDIFGIYAPSNIRMAINYGITENIMVGIGSTKDYKLQDLQWKYTFLQQTRSGSMPVSLSYYGNVVLDARAKENFGPEEQFKEIHRLSYFTQLIVARRFNFRYSAQIAPSFSYYNAVPTGMKNGNFGIHAGARAKVLGSSSIIAEYDQLLTQQGEGFDPKPNLALGVEIGTATHAFQIFIANYSQIINQRNLLYNTNDFAEGDFHFGFNITVRF